MIYEYFRAAGAHEAVQGLSDLLSIRLQDDDVQDFDTRWEQALLAASEIPTVTVLEGLHMSKLQDSVQLHTVLDMYEQETVRKNEPPNFSRFKTIVRRHVDQTMRATQRHNPGGLVTCEFPLQIDSASRKSLESFIQFTSFCSS